MTDTISTILLADGFGARLTVGLVLAGATAVAARRGGLLTRGGAVAACVLGAASTVAGWGWAATLVLYFAAAAMISRIGKRTKQRLTGSVVGKGGARDAAQVLANGGIYCAAALGASTARTSLAPLLTWGALGALAASSADTWATEIGVLSGRRPRNIVGRSFVQLGMSGGVTLPGLVGALVGASVVAVAGWYAGLPHGAALAAVGAGWAGAVFDSLLGATVQQRRMCDSCGSDTELAVHTCGTATRHVAGIRWIDNDVVNLLATMAGFGLSAALYLFATHTSAT